MPTDKPQSGPEARDTKSRILDVAEGLFGDQGYSGTSLRAVTRGADANLAAVHYHFGSKIGLFEAVFTRRVGEINDERLVRLDALQADSRGDASIEELLLAFLGPAFSHPMATDPTWPRFQRFIGRVMSETGEHVEAMRHVFREVQLRFLPAFQAALPHLTSQDVIWRTHLMVGSMCNVLSDPTRITVLSDGMCDGDDVDETLRQMVAFFSAGMRAPAAREQSLDGRNSPTPAYADRKSPPAASKDRTAQ